MRRPIGFIIELAFSHSIYQRIISKEEMELVPEDELIVESDFVVILWRTRVAYKVNVAPY